VYGSKSLSKRQIKILNKLDKYDVKSSSGKITEIGKTPTWLSVKIGLNKNNLIEDLPLLTDYALVDHITKVKKNQQNWNYYTLSELGEVIVIKDKIKEISRIGNDESTFEDEKKILDVLKNNLQYVRGEFWDKLRDFGNFPYWCLRQSILAFDFFVRIEGYLGYVLVSVLITLPSKNGSGFNRLEKTHHLFVRDNSVTKSQSKVDLSNLGLVIPDPRIEVIGKKGNDNFKGELKTTIENFLTYSFYSYFVQNIFLINKIIKNFDKETHDITVKHPENLEMLRNKIKNFGNDVLSWFNEPQTNLTFGDIITKMDYYENKTNQVLQNKPLKNKLEDIQKSIEGIKSKTLIS